VLLDKFSYPNAYLIAHSAKDLHSLVVGTFRWCRVINRPVLTKADTGEDWATVPRAITNRDDVREVQAEESGYILRTLTRDINSDFAHGFNRQRIQSARLQAGTLRVEPITSELPQPSFRHLAAAGVASAEKQDITHGKPP
jgi:hypothetical protein